MFFNNLQDLSKKYSLQALYLSVSVRSNREGKFFGRKTK